MGTVIRPEISEKNKYWISKHRYYELKHFCLQYREWKKEYVSIMNGLIPSCRIGESTRNSGYTNDTCEKAVLLEDYSNKIQLVEQCAYATDEYLYQYILKGVTENYTYEYLHTRMGIPCCRDTYYARYRKFFWILNKYR